MAMARCDSVTVSIADDETGMFIGMLREKRVVVSASVGRTSLRAGMRVTSSNVRASWISPASIINTSNIGAGLSAWLIICSHLLGSVMHKMSLLVLKSQLWNVAKRVA